MGVMQVTRSLKPQDSCCVLYLAGADSQKKHSGSADDSSVDSHSKLSIARAIIEKAANEANQYGEFAGDSPGCTRQRHEESCEKQDITGNLNSPVLETDVPRRAEQAEYSSCYDRTGWKIDCQPNDSVDSSITKRVHTLLKSYQEGKSTRDDEQRTEGLGAEDLKHIETISNDIEGEIVRRYSGKELGDKSTINGAIMKRVTRRKAPDMKVQICGRGRPRKKSFGKRGNSSCDKQSNDGSENGEGRTSRGRQQRGGSQGNGGGNGGGRRRRDDDDRDDDNDDVEDDFDDNNEDEDEEEDEQTGTESVVDEMELTLEQEAEMTQVGFLSFTQHRSISK